MDLFNMHVANRGRGKKRLLDVVLAAFQGLDPTIRAVLVQGKAGRALPGYHDYDDTDDLRELHCR